MCLRFVFLVIMRLAAWLRLSRREQAWQTADILILRHQLAVLQRRQPRRPNLNWADRALLTTLLGVTPKARRHGLRLLVTPTRSCAGTATSSAAAGPPGPCAARPADRRPAGASGHWSAGWPGKTPNGDTAGSTASWPAWESRSQRRPYGRSSRPAASTPPGDGPGRPGHNSCAPRPTRSWRATSSRSTCSTAPRPMSWP
jgi:hypothetical protein